MIYFTLKIFCFSVTGHLADADKAYSEALTIYRDLLSNNPAYARRITSYSLPVLIGAPKIKNFGKSDSPNLSRKRGDTGGEFGIRRLFTGRHLGKTRSRGRFRLGGRTPRRI